MENIFGRKSKRRSVAVPIIGPDDETIIQLPLIGQKDVISLPTTTKNEKTPVKPISEKRKKPQAPPDDKLELIDYELRLLNDNIHSSVKKCLDHNIAVMQSFVSVKVDEFKQMRLDYKTKFQKLAQDRANFEKEKEEFKKSQQEIAKKAGGMSDNIVRLEVGGTFQFSINHKHLTHFKGSLMEQSFTKNLDLLKKINSVSISPHFDSGLVQERIYLDRNGDAFFYVADYLRENGESLPVIKDENLKRVFEKEIQYWGIESKVWAESKVPIQAVAKIKQEPHFMVDGFVPQSLNKWQQLGPIDLLDFYKNIPNFINFVNFIEKSDEDGNPISYKLSLGDYSFSHSNHIYTGQLDPHTLKPHGLGRKISLKNGRILEGQFIAGIATGYARYIWDNGDYYIGYVKDSMANGKGTLYKGKQKQEGEWKDWAFI